MLDHVWSWIKQHPYATAGIVFVVGIILWLLLRKGSGGAAASPFDSFYAAQAASTQSGNALVAAQNANTAAVQQAQIQADAATTVAGYQRDVLNAQTSGAVQVANISAGAQTQIAQLMAQLGTEQAQQSTIQTGLTTSGAVQLSQIQTAGAVQINAANATAGVQTAQVAGTADMYRAFVTNYLNNQNVAYQYGQGVTGLAPAAVAPFSLAQPTYGSNPNYALYQPAANQNIPQQGSFNTSASQSPLQNTIASSGYDFRKELTG